MLPLSGLTCCLLPPTTSSSTTPSHPTGRGSATPIIMIASVRVAGPSQLPANSLLRCKLNSPQIFCTFSTAARGDALKPVSALVFNFVCSMPKPRPCQILPYGPSSSESAGAPRGCKAQHVVLILHRSGIKVDPCVLACFSKGKQKVERQMMTDVYVLDRRYKEGRKVEIFLLPDYNHELN